MFARGISILISASLDVGNLAAPRPYDGIAEQCGQAAMRALQAPLQFMPPSSRVEEPERWAHVQRGTGQTRDSPCKHGAPSSLSFVL